MSTNKVAEELANAETVNKIRRGRKIVSVTTKFAFNINNYIRFKPTAYGLEILSKEDRDIGLSATGTMEMQVWDWANVFGPHLGMAMKEVMESNNIEFIERDYTVK